MYRYSLISRQPRDICPQCRQRSFSVYADSSSHPLDAATCGRCNRINSCGYHLPPRQWREARNAPYMLQQPREPMQSTLPLDLGPVEPSCLPMRAVELSEACLGRFRDKVGNKFDVAFMRRLCPIDPHSAVWRSTTADYRLGSTRFGEPVFWQIDTDGLVRTGKYMKYDADGHRLHTPGCNVGWVHTCGEAPKPYSLRQVMYGTHLLGDDTCKVAIVESEKTALVLTTALRVCFPRLRIVVLATGGCSNLNPSDVNFFDRYSAFAPLIGRRIVLLPDRGMEEKWSGSARLLKPWCRRVDTVTMSGLAAATAVPGWAPVSYDDGADIADLIVGLMLRVKCMGDAKALKAMLSLVSDG